MVQRQTNRLPDRQTNKQTDMTFTSHSERVWLLIMVQIQTNKHTDKQTNRQTNKQTDKQTDMTFTSHSERVWLLIMVQRQTNKQTDKQTDMTFTSHSERVWLLIMVQRCSSSPGQSSRVPLVTIVVHRIPTVARISEDGSPEWLGDNWQLCLS